MKIFTPFLVCSTLLLPTLSACAQTTPPAAAPVAAVQTDPLTNKAEIGVGLEGLADWSRAMMFADAMKTSRNWGKADQPWVPEIQTDALGWPTQDAGVVVTADSPGLAGTYQLSFEGRADVRGHARVTIENLAYDAATKRSTAQVVVPDGETSLMLSFENTDGGVKNVKLMRPNTDADATFSPAFLEKLGPFPVMRFMDFLSTNNNPVAKWEDRTTVNHATQTRAQGGALEYVVELANLTGKDIWVNVPDQADENYTRQMAQMLKDGLKPDIKVYVEYSNEVWNWQFQQATRNLDAAKIEGKAADSPLAFDKDQNEGYWAMRRIAQRGAQVGQVFREVFGDTDMSRVRPVYATQVGYEEVYKQGLGFLESQYGSPNKAFYAIAGAPYFNLNDEENKRGDISVDEIFAVLPDRIDQTLDSAETLGSYATYYGLKHMAYEGGQHLQDHEGNGSADAKAAANRDPRMGPMVEKYLKGWAAIDGDLFVYFTLTSPYTKWGSWGLLEDTTKTSPKYDAALKVVNSPPIPIVAGAAVPGTVAAGDWLSTNRWDNKKDAKPTIGVEPDKWIQYQVRAPKTASYNLSMEADGEGKAEILVNAQSAGTLATGDALSVPLTAGLNVIRVKGKEGRFELKSLQVAAP